MKTQTLANPLITSENMSSSVMGMDAKGSEMASYYLRDKIYSDKVQAVVREYACNALDEHKKHKIEKAVEIGIRNEGDSSIFFVRDFAKGLSEHDIRNVFGMYFRSTKSGDNEQIGGFGIGSKAAHCYTDTFYIKSYHNGVCTLYACALGGGNSGVPVGHILKVSEDATQETGLEVYLEIKSSSDINNFKQKSIRFVEYCSANIVFEDWSARIEAMKPLSQIEKNGFTFRFFEKSGSVFEPSNFHIKMGNVTYKNCRIDSFLKTPFLKEGIVLCVDVPIGTMSLPISRENFENTASNNRVIGAIEAAVVEAAQEEIKAVKPMSLEELIKDRNNVFVESEHFQSHKRNAYKDIYPFVQGVSVIGSATDFEKFKNKPVCAIIKSRRTLEYWREKFSSFAIKNGKKYYLICSNDLEACDTKKINEIFETRNVKSSIFGLPKTEKSKTNPSMETPFSVSFKERSGNYRNLHLDALGVYNYICSTHDNLASVSNIAQAKQNISEMTFDSLRKLNAFTVKKSNSNSGCTTTVVRGANMHKNLISLGFLDVDSEEYKNKHEQTRQLENEKRNIAQNISNLRKPFLSVDVIDALAKKAERNAKFSIKANCVFDKIRKETSIRGKIMETMHDSGSFYYSKSPRISRKELRTILRLK